MAHGCCIRCCKLQLLTLVFCFLFLTTLSAAEFLESKALSPPTKSPPLPTKSPRPPRSPPSLASRPPPISRSPPSPRKPTSKPPPPRASPPVPKPPRAPPSPELWRPRDGIRLVGYNSTSRGWLEMLIPTQVGYNDTTNTWMYESVWTPICGPLPRDNMPQLLCQLLGFPYGQLYFEAGGNYYFVVGSAYRQFPGTKVLGDCDVKDAPSGKLVANVDEFNCWFEDDSATSYPDCSWLLGFRGVVALQCSGIKMPPAPPSPPPPPPPPRRDVAQYINLVDLEENFNTTSDYEDYYSSIFSSYEPRYRVELLVNTSSNGRTGSKVWAPLCALAGSNLDIEILTETVCNQANADKTGIFTSTVPRVRKPVPIPKGAVPEGGFNPAKYKRWVTVVGGVKKGLDAVQQMNLTVTTTPCSGRKLFNLACSLRSI